MENNTFFREHTQGRWVLTKFFDMSVKQYAYHLRFEFPNGNACELYMSESDFTDLATLLQQFLE